MRRERKLLLPLVLCALLAHVGANCAAEGESVDCPCIVYHEEIADPTPFGQRVDLAYESAFIDASRPFFVRHGSGGTKYSYMLELGDAGICEFARTMRRFELMIDGVLVEPTRLVIYPVFGTPELGTGDGRECPVLVYWWMFEFPAGYLGSGTHAFTGHWIFGGGDEEDQCPDMIRRENWSTPRESYRDCTVLVIDPTP